MVSTEALAQEEIPIEQSHRMGEEHRPLHVRLSLFPVLVTNAKVVVCKFDPKSIKLEHGTLESSDAEIFEVSMLRFRKSLVTKFPDGMFYTLEAANRACERTVLIINANHLIDTLKKWDMDRMPDRIFAVCYAVLSDCRPKDRYQRFSFGTNL